MSLNSSSSSSQNLLNIKLSTSWNFYIHFSDDKNWNLDSYIHIINIKNITEAILFEEQLCSKMVQNCMIFIMKDGIGPTWEHPRNKNGGCFSYKINNKYLYKVFKLVYYSLLTNKLSGNNNFNKKINGITISPKNTIAPKKNFSILKIWMETCEYMDPEIIYPIEGLFSKGCLFKKHNPEN